MHPYVEPLASESLAIKTTKEGYVLKEAPVWRFYGLLIKILDFLYKF